MGICRIEWKTKQSNSGGGEILCIQGDQRNVRDTSSNFSVVHLLLLFPKVRVSFILFRFTRDPQSVKTKIEINPEDAATYYFVREVSCLLDILKQTMSVHHLPIHYLTESFSISYEEKFSRLQQLFW